MDSIRILIADDHPVVTDGLVAVLSTQPDFEVVGVALTGIEVLERTPVDQPEVVLLDLEMPEMDGVEVLKRLREEHPEVKAIVFTAFDSDERIVSAVQAGAKGYLLKGAPRQELFQAVRTVNAGGSLLQPVVASKLIEHVRGGGVERDQEYQRITARETDVLRLLAQGKTNKEIALELVISERTVKFHVSSILKKLRAGNRTEAVTNAAGLGLVSLDERK